MGVTRVKTLAGLVGASAIVAAITVSLMHSGGPTPTNVAGGSGDSSVTGAYSSPTVPAMSINPTNMNMGATVTEAAPGTTVATSVASPALKAPVPAGCVNNGICP